MPFLVMPSGPCVSKTLSLTPLAITDHRSATKCYAVSQKLSQMELAQLTLAIVAINS
jgi:hypothetical protein